MNIFNRVTFKTMKKNPVRTLVTIIGIVISTAMFTAVTTLAISLYSFMYRTEVYDDGSWHIGCENASYESYVKWCDSELTESIGAAKILGYAECGSTNENKPYIFLESADDEFFKLMPVHVTAGRLPEKSDEIILPEHLYNNGNVNYRLGDIIKLELGNRYVMDGQEPDLDYKLNQGNPYIEDEILVTYETRSYIVVGFYSRPAFENYTAPGYTALTYGGQQDDEQAEYNFYVREHKKYLSEVWNIEFTEGRIRYNSNIISMEGSFLYANVMQVFIMLAVIFVIIIAAGSITMIYSAFSISVSERTKQFGLLASVGATKKQIKRMVFGEAAMVSLVGIPVGVLCGIAGIGVTLYFVGSKFNYILTSPYSVDLVVNGYAILAAVITAFITVAVSAFIPAVRATKVSAIDAIRQHKDVRMPRSKWHAGRKYRLTQKLFGTPGMLARRYFSRSRKKYRVTIFSLSMSIVLFIVTSSYCAYLKGYISDSLNERDLDKVNYYMHNEEEATLEKIKGIMKTSEGVSQAVYYSADAGYYAVCKENELNEKYIQYAQKLAELDYNIEVSEVDEASVIMYVDDECYGRYINALGLDKDVFSDYVNAPAIFKNSMSTSVSYVDSNGKPYRFSFEYSLLKDDAKSVRLVNDETVTEYELGAVVDTLPDEIGGYNYCTVLIYPYSSKYNTQQTHDTQIFKIMWKDKMHDEMMESVKKNLSSAGFRTGASYFYDPLESASSRSNMIALINVFSYGFIALMALICVANVFNTISTNVSLRRRDFAMLRSVGLSYGGIKRMMVFECVLYGLRSIIFAAPVSIICSFLIYKGYGGVGSFGFSFYIPWYSIVASVLGVFAVVGMSMAYSISKIREDNLIDEVKEEND